MTKKWFWVLLLGIYCEYGLSCRTNTNNIDRFIEKNQDKNYEEFKGVMISTRSIGERKIIYILSRTLVDIPPYFVHYDRISHRVVRINRSALERKNINDYFSDTQIEKYVQRFQDLDLYLLGVDDDGNIYFHPFRFNEPPLLLKLKKSDGSKEIRKGYVYDLYEGSWYLNRHH
jgi:hypothetical protein